MRHPLRVIILACALACTPACASLRAVAPAFENPMGAARTLDQRAYVLLNAYAALLEEATEIVRDPAVPVSLKRALGQTESVATPAIEALEIAVAGYARARADFEAATSRDQPALERATAALSIAARRLTDANATAEAPIGELKNLIRARRG